MQTVPSVSLLLLVSFVLPANPIHIHNHIKATKDHHHHTPTITWAAIDFNLSHPLSALFYTAIRSLQTLFLGGLTNLFPVAAVLYTTVK